MKAFIAIVAQVTFATCQTAPGFAQPSDAAKPSFSVQQESFDDTGHPAIHVTIWVPNISRPLGLIVISHGTGAGPVAHIDTAETLAKAGFVVAAPIHPGDNFQDDTDVGKPSWFADRSRHVSKVIDYMHLKWDGHARIAARKVGVFGFSAGGTTALISIGGSPNLSNIAQHCASTPEFVCKILGPQATTEPPKWTHDRRIAAAVIAAPGIGFAFDPEGLRDVHVPVQLWAGTADETVPYLTNTAVVRGLLPNPPEFHSVDDAVHLSFLAPCTPQTPTFLCQDKPGFDRVAFHQAFNQSVTEFFKRHLRRR